MIKVIEAIFKHYSNVVRFLFYVVVIAAGNEGRKGAFMVSSPSTGYDVISVASVDNEYSLQPVLSVESTDEKFRKLFYSLERYTLMDFFFQKVIYYMRSCFCLIKKTLLLIRQ